MGIMIAESMIPDFQYEDAYDGPVCGVDEVGRGPLAGPVVAAAVIWNRSLAPRDIMDQIRDSKMLTPQKREYLFNKIQEYADISVAHCTVSEIDRINILQASLKAMKKAVNSLATPPAVALIDGNKAPKLTCKTETIIKGDAKSLSIAAASIIAKHTRDQMMVTYAKKYPHYAWETNVGYGTAAHLEAIRIHGVTILHRRSFAPVRERLALVSDNN